MDWSSPYNGGYLTNRVRPVRFVKAQQTAWSINPFILTAVLNMAWDKDHSIGGIPPKTSIEEPPKPHDIDTNEDARREWRKEAYQVFQENREIDGKRVSFRQTLDTARPMKHGVAPQTLAPRPQDAFGGIAGNSFWAKQPLRSS